MKIIAFEGMDKSGKHTASVQLAEHLISLGYKVVQSEFHRYDTPTGKLIQDYLYGKYKVSNETIQLIMSADKQAQQEWIKDLEESGVDFLILDRYYLSQKVYSNYFIDKSEYTPEEVSLYKGLYTDIIKCFRKADITIYLDNTAETSMSRKGQHGENDLYEQNKELLEYVRTGYLEEVQKEKQYLIISSEQTIEEVKNELIEKFKYFLD